MLDLVFIGERNDANHFRQAGVPAYAPSQGRLVERVLAERWRCRVMAMREATFNALPADLARELREGEAPRLAILPPPTPDENLRSLPHDILTMARRRPHALQ